VVLAIGHALGAHEALSRPDTLSSLLEVVHSLFEEGVFVGHDQSIRIGAFSDYPMVSPSPAISPTSAESSLAQPAITSDMMHAVHLRLTMRRFTFLLASALVVVFGGAACGVGHFAYVGFASRSLNKCLVLPWLSDLVAR
jgi:hypothetical protein